MNEKKRKTPWLATLIAGLRPLSADLSKLSDDEVVHTLSDDEGENTLSDDVGVNALSDDEILAQWEADENPVRVECRRGDSKCFCGKGIRYVFQLINKFNGNRFLPVGSTCILACFDVSKKSIDRNIRRYKKRHGIK